MAVAQGATGLVWPREAAGTSLWRDAWRRLLRNRLAVMGGCAIILLCLVAIFANFIAPYAYTKSNFDRTYEFPSKEFPLGTDQLGRDVLSRMIYGARVSMLVGLGAQVIVVLIGVSALGNRWRLMRRNQPAPRARAPSTNSFSLIERTWARV